MREKNKNQNTPPLKIPHPLQNTRALPLSVPARNRRAEKQKGLSLKQPPHEHILPATKSEATCCDFELLEYFVWLRKMSLTIFLDAQRPIPLGLILQVTKLFFFLPHCMSCGILAPDQGLNLYPLKWKHRVQTTGPPGKSLMEH